MPVASQDDHRGQWVLRRVASNGMVSVDNQLFSVTDPTYGDFSDGITFFIDAAGTGACLNE